jgi:hypothetical protein
MTRADGLYPCPGIAAPARYLAALLTVVIVFLAYRGSGTVIDEGSLYLLLGIAVLGSAWFAGTGCALAVTVLGAVLGSMAGGTARSPAVRPISRCSSARACS